MRAAILFVLTACGAATELDGRDAAPEVSTTPIEAGPPPFCESLTLKPLFCDDFDDGTLGPWTSRSSSNEGAIALTSDASRSPPFAMSATIADGSAQAAVAKSFPDLTGSMHVMLSFSMLASADCFAESTQLENLDVAQIEAAPKPSSPPLRSLSVSLAIAGTLSALVLFQPEYVGGVVRSFSTVPIAPIPEDGTWQRVAIDIDLRGDAPHMTAVTPSGSTTTPMIVVPNELDHPSFRLGALANDGTHTTSCTVLFDDVIFDAR